MATLKIEFRKSKKLADGRTPVFIRCTCGNRVARHFLTSAHPHEWDAKNNQIKPRSRAGYAKTNVDIENTFHEFEERFLALKQSGRDFDPAEVFKQNTQPEEAAKALQPLTFFEIADLYFEGIQTQSGFSYQSYASIVGKFKRFLGTDQFYLSDFTPGLVQRYITYMRNIGNANTTINCNLKVLRFVSQYAYRNQLGDKPAALHDFKLPPRGNPQIRTKLTPEQFEAFTLVKLDPGTKIYASQQMFMLAVYLRGMRISDVLQLKADSFVGGRLIYEMQKTGNEQEMELEDEAKKIVAEFTAHDDLYLFPFLRWQYDPRLTLSQNNALKTDAIKTATALINKNLRIIAGRAGIKQNVSSHSARHTFGKMAIDEIPDPMITMELMGHGSIKEHQRYIKSVTASDRLNDAAKRIFRKKKPE